MGWGYRCTLGRPSLSVPSLTFDALSLDYIEGVVLSVIRRDDVPIRAGRM